MERQAWGNLKRVDLALVAVVAGILSMRGSLGKRAEINGGSFEMSLIKIVSGGQTGVDRGALDAALAAGFPCGGWCPGDNMQRMGRFQSGIRCRRCRASTWMHERPGRSEDNTGSGRFGIGGAANGTAILFSRTLSGGTKFTRDLCIREKKPFVVLDATQISEAAAAAAIVRFVEENEIQVLNVAGPRATDGRRGMRLRWGWWGE